MKSLYDYIIESTDPEDNAEQLEETKTFKFDFSKFENAKETVKTIVSSAEDYITDQSETSFTLTFKKADATKLSGVVEIIKAFLKKEAHTPKRSSDEQFAQYCASQEKIFGDMETFVTEVPKPEEQPNVQAQKDEENADKDNDEQE
jgi:hypothetical protein